MVMSWSKLLNPERIRKSTSKGLDHRIEFERDYDRTIFSTPVRRLQDKAQVFPLEPNDSVRTRLTHSLEVSTVSKGIAISVSQWMLDNKYIESYMARQIETIASTCGLVHDLGNPPFGHSGEDAVREWFKEKQINDLKYFFENNNELAKDFLNFDGNAQTLRLLTRLQVLADFNGLNLTVGTLSAACKYIASSSTIGIDGLHEFSKLGVFNSEIDVFRKIQEYTGTTGCRNPITFLVEAADDIVYSIVDIEDGVKKRIISWERIKKELIDKVTSDIGKELLEQSFQFTEKIVQLKPDEIISDISDEIHVTAFRTAYIWTVIQSVVEEFKNSYNSIMTGEYHDELVKNCGAKELVKACKEIGREIIYCSHETLELELLGRHIIKKLLDLFWEGAKHYEGTFIRTNTFHGKILALMSKNYKMVFIHNKNFDLEYRRLQLITDQLCGMTDTYSCDLYKKLNNGKF